MSWQQESISNYKNLYPSEIPSKSKNKIDGQIEKSVENIIDIGHLGVYLLGSTNSGKTMFFQYLTDTLIKPYKYTPTLASYSQNVSFNYMQTKMKLTIYDLSSSMQSNKSRIHQFKNSYEYKVALIFCDISSESSYKDVKEYIKQWQKNIEKQHINNIILIANKVDVESAGQRKVSRKNCLDLARKYRIVWLQYSNLTHYPLNSILYAAIIQRLCQMGVRQKVEKFVSQKQKRLNKPSSPYLFNTKANQLRLEWHEKIKSLIEMAYQQIIIRQSQLMILNIDTLKSLAKFLAAQEKYRKWKPYAESIKVMKKLMEEKKNEEKDSSIIQCSNNTYFLRYAAKYEKILRLEGKITEKKNLLQLDLMQSQEYIKSKVTETQKNLQVRYTRFNFVKILQQLQTWIQTQQALIVQQKQKNQEIQLRSSEKSKSQKQDEKNAKCKLQEQQKVIDDAIQELKVFQQFKFYQMQIQVMINALIKKILNQLEQKNKVPLLRDIQLNELITNLMDFFIEEFQIIENKQNVNPNDNMNPLNIFVIQKPIGIGMFFFQLLDLLGKQKVILEYQLYKQVHMTYFKDSDLNFDMCIHEIDVIRNWLQEYQKKQQNPKKKVVAFFDKLFG